MKPSPLYLAILLGLSGEVLAVDENSTFTCTTVNQRKAWHTLTNAEKQAYINAELCLMATAPKIGTVEGAQNRWDEIHHVHIAQANTIHAVGAFLPWHRLFVRAHEILLQDECGYEGSQPYWDEKMDIANLIANDTTMADLSVFDASTGFGRGTDLGTDKCVQDGPFVDLLLHLSATSTSEEGYCLTRDSEARALEAGEESAVETCMATTTYEEARDCFENGGPHSAGHGGVGGLMVDLVASPGDPLFFLHHAYLDKRWAEWQALDLPARLTDISGQNIPDQQDLDMMGQGYPSDAIVDYFGDDGGNVTTLTHNLWMAGVIANATIEDVMDVGGTVSCATYI